MPSLEPTPLPPRLSRLGSSRRCAGRVIFRGVGQGSQASPERRAGPCVLYMFRNFPCPYSHLAISIVALAAQRGRPYGRWHDQALAPPFRRPPPPPRSCGGPAPQPVTPMTPDVVASYDPVLPQADFVKRVAMVPMRDGTKLYTVMFMKKGTTNGPILLSRTPYDAKGSTSGRPASRSSTCFRSCTRSSSTTVTSSSSRISAGSTIQPGHVRDEPADRRPAQQHAESTKAPTPTTRSTGW